MVFVLDFRYVLPNHMLLQMAEILPRERQGVLACCNPIPPLVRQCQHEIHNLIMEARESTLMQVAHRPLPLSFLFSPLPLLSLIHI